MRCAIWPNPKPQLLKKYTPGLSKWRLARSKRPVSHADPNRYEVAERTTDSGRRLASRLLKAGSTCSAESGFFLKLRVQLIVLAVATILMAPWLSAATFCSQQETPSREQCPADCPMDCPEQAPSAPVKVLCCHAAPAETAIPLSIPKLQASSLTVDLDTSGSAPAIVNPVVDVPFGTLDEMRGHTAPSPQSLLCTFLI